METIQDERRDLKIELGDVTICYDDFGRGLYPIIFIHGFPFDKSMWKPQMEFLKNNNRVIDFDIRGYGKSTAGKSKASINLFADDLIKFMDSLKITKAIVCGLSMGGYILLNAVSRFPERFHALILSDTQCIADSTEGKEKRFKTIELIENGGLKEFAEGFVKNIFFKKTFIDNNEVVEKIQKTVLSTSTETITGTLRALAERGETCSTLAKIAIPVLIICGKEDIITTPVQAEFLNNNIKNSEMHIIDNAGHLSNLEQPGEFNQHIDNFISRLNKG